MDLLAQNYESSGSDTDSEGTEPSLETPKETTLSRLPAEIAEKYNLQPSLPKVGIMSVKGSLRALESWSTFIYYEWRPNRLDRMRLMKIVSEVNDFCQKGPVPFAGQLRFEPLHISSLGAPLSLHISLSQTIAFDREADRNALFESLQEKILNSDQIKPFDMEFRPELRILPSYSKGTVFLTLVVDPEIKTRQIKPVNKIIQEALAENFPLKLPQEIESLTCMPSTAHMSIGLATNLTNSTLNNLNFLNTLLPANKDASNIGFQVKSLKFDKNRQVLSIPLSG